MVLERPAHWTVRAPDPLPLAPGDPRQIGGFRLQARLGSGGMGTVFLGVRRGKQAAVKVIRPDHLADRDAMARFRREVKAAGTVHSRFTADLIAADADATTPWLATEYVPGPTLAAAVSAHGAMPKAAVLSLVSGVAEALQAIHGAGLVHRDLKPSNIILGSDGPRVIDLGVVGARDATTLTATGDVVGTPAFMAPELAAGYAATQGTDVWALGSLAYYAATGKRLYARYSGSHLAVLLHKIATEPPDFDDCPGYLRPLLEVCLERSPEARPSLDVVTSLTGRYPEHHGGGVAGIVTADRTASSGERWAWISGAAVILAVFGTVGYALGLFQDLNPTRHYIGERNGHVAIYHGVAWPVRVGIPVDESEIPAQLVDGGDITARTRGEVRNKAIQSADATFRDFRTVKASNSDSYCLLTIVVTPQWEGFHVAVTASQPYRHISWNAKLYGPRSEPLDSISGRSEGVRDPGHFATLSPNRVDGWEPTCRITDR